MVPDSLMQQFNQLRDQLAGHLAQPKAVCAPGELELAKSAATAPQLAAQLAGIKAQLVAATAGIDAILALSKGFEVSVGASWRG